MHRPPALRNLSSDHHIGLVLARRARRAAGEDASAQRHAWRELTACFRDELEPHFRRDETDLLPALRAAGLGDLVERTLVEHAVLRALVAEDRVEHLARFADALTAHIRFEEQVLFEAAQRSLSAAQLSALQSDAEAARGS